MSIKSIGLVLLGLAISFAGMSQEYDITNVTKISKRNQGTVFNNGVVSGYYFFYESEKLKGGQRGYQIEVVDQNLKLIAKESMPMGKKTTLVETAYNGEHLLFKFYDGKEKRVLYRVLTKEGKFTPAVSRALDKWEDRYYLGIVAGGGSGLSLSAPNTTGFVDIYSTKEKALKYQCTFIGNDGKIKWNYTPNLAKGVNTGEFLIGDDNQIVIMESHAKSVNSKDYTFHVTGLDMEGEEVYNVPLQSKLYNLMPHNAIINPENKNVVLIGEYYNKADKMLKAESRGVFLRGISEEGLWQREKFIDWNKDVKPKMSKDEFDQAKKFSVYFHDIVQTKDGNIIAIGEQYKKQASALGIASQLSNSDDKAAATEIRIGEMVFLEINKDIELEDVYIFDKKNNSVMLEAGQSTVSKHYQCKMIAAAGLFDYEFNQFNSDKSVMTVAFTDRVKEKGKISKQSVIQLVSYVDEDQDFTKDQITKDTEADYLWIGRAKPGYILLSEYYRKQKKFVWHLEPVNF